MSRRKTYIPLPESIPVRIQVRFLGPEGPEKPPLGAFQHDVQVTPPTQPGEMSLLVVQLDAREIVAKLAMALGMIEQQKQRSGIIVPSKEPLKLPTRLKVD